MPHSPPPPKKQTPPRGKNILKKTLIGVAKRARDANSKESEKK